MTDAELTDTLHQRLTHVHQRITTACERIGRSADSVTLIAVTKRVSIRVVRALAALGVRNFGENRPQELWNKSAAIPDAHWHLIGHLQRNKLDKTLPLTHLIHSVDSERLLTAINDFGVKRGQPTPILLEVNCSREEAKGGLEVSSLPKVIEVATSMPGVSLQGLMTMAAFHDDPELCRPTFRELKQLGEQFPIRSMGMSNDFEIAIEEGATHVRIGTTLMEGLEAE